MQQLITGHKTSAEIESMRQGGRILAQIFAELRDFTHAGLTKIEIDSFVAKKIKQYGVIATYQTAEVGFPGVICISVNDEVVHGVPDDYTLRIGDIVSYDLVITHQSMKVDSAFTMVVDQEPSGAVKHLISTTQKSLKAGIDSIKGPTYTGTIGYAIEQVLAKAKLGIVRDLVGHGVGFRMHMPPDIPNYGNKNTGVLLQPGDTVAIEPMATLGGERVAELDDGWTYATSDGSLSAHFEHTVLVTETGAEIITSL